LIAFFPPLKKISTGSNYILVHFGSKPFTVYFLVRKKTKWLVSLTGSFLREDKPGGVAPTSGKTFRLQGTRTALSPAAEKYFPTGLWLLRFFREFFLRSQSLEKILTFQKISDTVKT